MGSVTLFKYNHYLEFEEALDIMYVELYIVYVLSKHTQTYI